MTYRFSINEQDIPELRDNDLRELIGLLCGAELNANGYSDALVRYDGHQDAADGGVDVNVESADFVLRQWVHPQSCYPLSSEGASDDRR